MNSKPTRPSYGGARSALTGGRSAGTKRPSAAVRAKSPNSRVRDAAAASAAGRFFSSMSYSAEIVTILVVIVIGVFTLAPQVNIWFNQRQQIADLQTQVAQAKQDLANMKVERKRWEDPVYIRSQARDRLYYVMPGEVSYLVMDANGINTSDVSGTMGQKLAASRNTTNFSTSISHAKKNWVNSLMQTFVRAGLDEPVAAKPGDPLTGKTK